MLVTSTTENKNMVINVIKLVKHFLYSTIDTQSCLLNAIYMSISVLVFHGDLVYKFK